MSRVDTIRAATFSGNKVSVVNSHGVAMEFEVTAENLADIGKAFSTQAAHMEHEAHMALLCGTSAP